MAALHEARARIADCTGAKIHAELENVERTHRLVLGNCREVLVYLAKSEEPDTMLALWDVGNREVLERFLDEYDRLLHNYVASVTSLRDHTRRLWDKYPPADAGLNTLYREAVDAAFAKNGLARFVQGLRNYSTHRTLPVARGQLTYSPEEGEKSAVVLDRDQLLEWNGWTVEAKEFLAAKPKSFEARPVVIEYTELVARFHRWFIQVFVSGHREAVGEFNARVEKHNALVEEARKLPVFANHPINRISEQEVNPPEGS